MATSLSNCKMIMFAMPLTSKKYFRNFFGHFELVELFRLEAKLEVVQWQLQFDMEGINSAYDKIFDVMRLWKLYQRPGEVVSGGSAHAGFAVAPIRRAPSWRPARAARPTDSTSGTSTELSRCGQCTRGKLDDSKHGGAAYENGGA